jgi:hypothetical protein
MIMLQLSHWVLTILGALIFAFFIMLTPELARPVVLGGEIGFVGFAIALGVDRLRREIAELSSK